MNNYLVIEYMTTCPCCDVGELTEQNENRNLIMFGIAEQIESYFSVCDFCKSEIADNTQVHKNAKNALNFRNAIIEKVISGEIIISHEQCQNVNIHFWRYGIELITCWYLITPTTEVYNHYTYGFSENTHPVPNSQSQKGWTSQNWRKEYCLLDCRVRPNKVIEIKFIGD